MPAILFRQSRWKKKTDYSLLNLVRTAPNVAEADDDGVMAMITVELFHQKTLTKSETVGNLD
jgi:hypothetical protein